MSVRKGRAFEWEVRDDLLVRGYEVARCAGSRGLYDLVAIKPGRPTAPGVLLVQCRRNGELRPPGWNALLERAEKLHCQAILAHRQPGGVIVYEHLVRPRRPGLMRPSVDVSASL